MRATVRCLNCGHVETFVGPGGPMGTGPKDYLPGNYTADTCYVCTPDAKEAAGANPEGPDTGGSTTG
jgi:hypothetical protein